MSHLTTRPAPADCYPEAELGAPNFQDSQVAAAETRPVLRDPYPAAPIDPLSLAPGSKDLGRLYVEAREEYPDGMSLALANPVKPYAEIVEDYKRQHGEPGFSDVDFWNANFDTPEPDEGLFTAPPGMSLDQYTLAIRDSFIFPNVENDSFDIWLPYDRSVAGAGRFNRHSFLWDGYHMAKGYAADGRWDLVLNIVDNTEYEINTFGYGLNGSAAFLATRPQPPYFSHEVSMLADEYGDEALVRYLPAMEKEYAGYWMDGKEHLESLPDDGKPHSHRSLVRVAMGSGKFAYLNRYWDDAEGPRLESYLEDENLGKVVTRGLSGELQQRRLKKLDADLRAGAASGWDYSSRWFEDGRTLETINTTDVLPVDLNSLLARTEQVLARSHRAAGNPNQALRYEQLFQQRVAAINKFQWDPDSQIYRDHNFKQYRQTNVVSAATIYPLYVGIANAKQTIGVARAIENDLLFRGGIVATTTEDSSQQWDGGKKGGNGQKNVWAPPNWAAARGLARMAHILSESGSKAEVRYLLELSNEVRKSYMGGVQIAYDTHGTVPEKHNGDYPDQIGNGGEYVPVKALAMVGEIWRAMNAWDPNDPRGCLPVGALATSRLY